MVKSKSTTIIKILVSLGLPLVVGMLGSWATRPAIPTWYAALLKPSFAPPNWVFAPVWTGLYLLMGLAAFLVWRKGLSNRPVRQALLLFAGQLVLNLLWSFAFFGLRSPGAGLVVIVLLWLAIIVTVWRFEKVSPLAAGLLLPYLLWVSFALLLNFAIWKINP